MADRILASIARRRVEIKAMVEAGKLDDERVEALRGALDMDLSEFARFQELKSLAMMEGILTEEEAQTVFRLLGGVPAVFNAQDCATKAVLTKLFGELLGLKIQAAKARV